MWAHILKQLQLTVAAAVHSLGIYCKNALAQTKGGVHLHPPPDPAYFSTQRVFSSWEAFLSRLLLLQRLTSNFSYTLGLKPQLNKNNTANTLPCTHVCTHENTHTPKLRSLFLEMPASIATPVDSQH